MERIDYNKKMLGKKVSVENSPSPWEGAIVGVIDEENFSVKKDSSGKIYAVSMYDIRSLENETTR